MVFRVQWTTDDKRRVHELAQEGKSTRQIAAETKISAGAIWAIQTNFNLKAGTTFRPCLVCREGFGSEGNRNRLCVRCFRRNSALD